MRVFVGISFDALTKNEIYQIQSRLEEGRFIPQDNFHLTLAFIGETSEKNIEKIVDAIKEIDAKPFEITFDSIGRFARGRRSVCWLGIRSNNQLERMYQKLFEKLCQRGFDLQKRKFKPHISLARDVTSQKAFDAGIEPFSYKVTAISIFQSVFEKRGVRYEELEKIYI